MRKEFVHVQNHWRKALVYTTAIFVFLAIQSLVMEAPFIRGLDAGPAISGVEITKPPWPIYFIVAWENVFGARTMVLTPSVTFPLMIVFPFVVERMTREKRKQVLLGKTLFYTGAYSLLAISYWAAAGEIVAHIF